MRHISLHELGEQGVSHNGAIRKKVMLQRGDVPHLTNFAQATFAPGQVAPAHAHGDMHEVFFVASGTGTITINDVGYGLSPGVCILVEPQDIHEVRNTGQEPLVLTYFGIA